MHQTNFSSIRTNMYQADFGARDAKRKKLTLIAQNTIIRIRIIMACDSRCGDEPVFNTVVMLNMSIRLQEVGC